MGIHASMNTGILNAFSPKYPLTSVDRPYQTDYFLALNLLYT
ncbi:hypothetical protein CSC23_4850 (plasmid) [Escherichia coli]|nr:hypothetical protein CSC11_4893 [Escherichia coli]AWF18704.1 hypothetical protein CSC23_4850 [Escherichia coli]EPO85187.1 hypothetical protein H212_5053 [Klebsiella pneumoniae UHKPC67]